VTGHTARSLKPLDNPDQRPWLGQWGEATVSSRLSAMQRTITNVETTKLWLNERISFLNFSEPVISNKLQKKVTATVRCLNTNLGSTHRD